MYSDILDYKVSFVLIKLDNRKYNSSLSKDEKSILEFPIEILEKILQQINRQKLSNISDEKIFISLMKFKLSEFQIKYIFENFLVLKKKLMTNYPRRLLKSKSYEEKVKKKTNDFLLKGYSKDYAEAQARKQFKVDKYIPLKIIEGGGTNKR